MKERAKTLAINVLVVVVTVALVLAGVELYVTLTWSPTNSPKVDRYMADERLNHVFAPNYREEIVAHPAIDPYLFQTNSLGLRFDEPYPIAKPERELRVLFLGDSFVEGFEYSRTPPALLQQEVAGLFESTNSSLRVIHAGVGTYSPMLHYFALESKLMALEPDVVILAIDLTDARDDFKTYQALLYFNEDGEPAGVGSEMRRMIESLRISMVEELPITNPHYWIALAAGWTNAGRALYEPNVMQFATLYASLFKVIRPDLTVTRRMFDASDPETRIWIDYSLGWVRKISDVLAERDIPFVLVMYPWREQLREKELLTYFDPYRRFAMREGIEFVNTSPAFTAHPDAESLFLPGDPHFNYAGIALWTAYLAEAIRPRFKNLAGGQAFGVGTSTPSRP